MQAHPQGITDKRLVQAADRPAGGLQGLCGWLLLEVWHCAQKWPEQAGPFLLILWGGLREPLNND